MAADRPDATGVISGIRYLSQSTLGTFTLDSNCQVLAAVEDRPNLQFVWTLRCAAHLYATTRASASKGRSAGNPRCPTASPERRP